MKSTLARSGSVNCENLHEQDLEQERVVRRLELVNVG